MSSINAKTYLPALPQQVAFLGLGVMGLPMAGHLAKAGHDVTVYNRSAGKAQAWVSEFGGRVAATPREAALQAQIVFSCVGNDEDHFCGRDASDCLSICRSSSVIGRLASCRVRNSSVSQ